MKKIICILLCIFTFSCKQESTKIKTAPIVKTNEVINITETSAIISGSIISDGGDEINTKGLCWSTTENPTLNDNNIYTDSLISKITELKLNTTYYVRAFARNRIDISYGNSVTFRTIKPFYFNSNIDYGNLTDIEGNIYKTITLGNQEWMAENLNVKKYNDNTNIPNIVDDVEWQNLTTGSFCYFNNDTCMASIFGALYNWYAVNTDKLCPTGWHIPTENEWTTLELFLQKNGYNFDESIDLDNNRETNNKIAKSLASSEIWINVPIEETNIGSPNFNKINNNSTGFSAVPGGGRYFYGESRGYFNTGLWWTATDFDNLNAYYRIIYAGENYMNSLGSNKTAGYSIRCLKD